MSLLIIEAAARLNCKDLFNILCTYPYKTSTFPKLLHITNLHHKRRVRFPIEFEVSGIFPLATNLSCYRCRELCLYFPCQSAHLFQVGLALKQSLLLSCEKISLSSPKDVMAP